MAKGKEVSLTRFRISASQSRACVMPTCPHTLGHVILILAEVSYNSEILDVTQYYSDLIASRKSIHSS